MAAAAVRRLRPLLDRILVERIVPPTKTSGGILLPETSASGRLNEGLVVAVGPGARGKDGKFVPVSVKQGDKVLLPEFGGTTVKMADKEYQIFRDDDLIAVISD